MENEQITVKAESKIRLPMGLLGFEQIKDYVLIAKPEEEPFAWLTMPEDPTLAFLVIDPFIVLPDYLPDIPEADIKMLGINEPDDAMLLNIVTLRGNNRATVNLKGPIVINRHTLVGKQVIPNNAMELPLEHPLPASE